VPVDIPRGSLLLQDLVAHQDAVCSSEIGQVLVVAKGILVLKGGPKSSIPASVGMFQNGKYKSVITGEAFEYCQVAHGSLDIIREEDWILAIMFQCIDMQPEILQIFHQGLILSLLESVIVVTASSRLP